MKAVTAQLALGFVNTWYASSIAWRLGSSSRGSRPTGTGGGVSRDVGLGQVQVAREAESVPGVVDTAVLSSPQRSSSFLRSRTTAPQ